MKHLIVLGERQEALVGEAFRNIDCEDRGSGMRKNRREKTEVRIFSESHQVKK